MRGTQQRNKYLKEDGGEWVINSRPCPFLTEQGCSTYYSRPKACREYPFTDKKETVSRLVNLVENCEVCPVVFEIFEKLKKIYKWEFEEYKLTPGYQLWL
ncbi:MAG: YkgJ family cysteine cluster protein [Firmicutes bacterium]|nr:YkgJ family cysteine cluster protein [Bacillota bacterium]